ncbi:hypothetical protein BSPWISOXPB_5646 [uncultured Gammaproteobacteria bacterium]|nr:hypothetical protein BSPWISOXPB_5646 [uncultured Gammaproteobacteria bacterium]
MLGINKHKNKNKIKTCGEVYADSAYANKKNDEKLGQQNNKVLHRAYRNTPLTDRQKQEKNNAHPFAILLSALLAYSNNIMD